jgi:hypothetical protein
MKHVTLDDALDALRKAVAEKGYDYQYGEHHSACRYVSSDGEAQPQCIIGHALVYLGVPAEYLAESQWNVKPIRGVLEAGVLEGHRFDPRAIDAFHVAQDAQDYSCSSRLRGADTSWGAAVAAAENVGVNCPAQAVTPQ